MIFIIIKLFYMQNIDKKGNVEYYVIIYNL
jgi:hypothetical protein